MLTEKEMEYFQESLCRAEAGRDNLLNVLNHQRILFDELTAIRGLIKRIKDEIKAAEFKFNYEYCQTDCHVCDRSKKTWERLKKITTGLPGGE